MDKQHDQKLFCPILENTFSAKELAFLAKRGVLQEDKHGRINAMYIPTENNDYEVYSDCPEAHDDNQAMILFLDEGERISKEQLFTALNQSKNYLDNITFITINE